MKSKHTNRLIKETSPYLLQHAKNPVDWFPWSEEAFEQAKAKDLPVFLSIGYSTCHWCHVMEHESFEDNEVAELMNQSFISIKVDREERPDIDHVYMTVCQMMTGGGGWPLTIIMTPDKKPFFAGTYFPKQSRGGRIGMLELIEKVNDVWQNQRGEVNQSAQKITDYLNELSGKNDSSEIPDDLIGTAFESFKRLYDTKNGGFGTAPKFPSPHNLLFLLKHYHKTNDEYALEMVEKTLTEMSKGGIFDHLGFGFHRYSTDQKWLLPHFEKMLYDQATLSYVLVELYSITKNDYYKTIAEKVFDYVQRDLMAEEGFFYSAEDADSEGVEGKFYVWKTDELNELLSDEDYKLFTTVFNVDTEGNFEHETTRTKDGSNIPHMVKSIDELSKKLEMDAEQLASKLEHIRIILFNERTKRIRPLRDNKMLTDWNSLMAASFAYASRVFKNDSYLIAADKCISFILNNMVKDDCTLMHVYNGEASDIHGKLDDYAFLVFALIELYNASLNPAYLSSAITFNDRTIELFHDKDNAGFYLTSSEDESLITRPKNIYDSAIPSANSVAMMNLLRLSHLTGRTEYLNIVDKYISSNVKAAEESSLSFSFLLSVHILNLSKSRELIITDPENKHNPVLLAQNLTKKYSTNLSVVYLNKENRERMIGLADYLSSYELGEITKYYLCENYECDLPVDDLEKIIEKL